MWPVQRLCALFNNQFKHCSKIIPYIVSSILTLFLIQEFQFQFHTEIANRAKFVLSYGYLWW